MPPSSKKKRIPKDFTVLVFWRFSDALDQRFSFFYYTAIFFQWNTKGLIKLQKNKHTVFWEHQNFNDIETNKRKRTIYIWIWGYIYIMSLRGLCGCSTAHDARLHGPYPFLSPSKCVVEVMPLTVGQCHDNLLCSWWKRYGWSDLWRHFSEYARHIFRSAA